MINPFVFCICNAVFQAWHTLGHNYNSVIRIRYTFGSLVKPNSRDFVAFRLAHVSKMKHDGCMQTPISEWLESNTGESKRQMALRIGQTPSTFNRNIDMPDVIVAVCRAYDLNPVEALVEAGVISEDDVMDFAETTELEADMEKISTDSLVARMRAQVDELGRRVQGERPVRGQAALWDLVPAVDPDYSNMSAEDARDYGLAAKPEDEHIAHDELPNQP